jgi:diacylglycerol kinase family enzyme
MFAGTVDRVAGVMTRSGTEFEITSAAPVIYHLDGEPFVGAAAIRGRVRPRALKIRASQHAAI